MKYLLVLISAVIFLSCSNVSTSKRKDDIMAVEGTRRINADSLERVLAIAIETNNEFDYNDAAVTYMMMGQFRELLYYSMFMAYKNNSAIAHYHIYQIMNMTGGRGTVPELTLSGGKIKNLGLYHLLLSSEMGNKVARGEVERLFGKKNPRSKVFQ